VIGGQSVADHHPGVVADYGELLVAQRVHQRGQVTGQGAGVVPVRRLAGQPATALVGRDHRELPGQRRHHQPPGVPGLRPAVHQQQRRPVAADDHVLDQAAGVDVLAGERLPEPGRQTQRPRDWAESIPGGRTGR